MCFLYLLSCSSNVWWTFNEVSGHKDSWWLWAQCWPWCRYHSHTLCVDSQPFQVFQHSHFHLVETTSDKSPNKNRVAYSYSRRTRASTQLDGFKMSAVEITVFALVSHFLFLRSCSSAPLWHALLRCLCSVFKGAVGAMHLRQLGEAWPRRWRAPDVWL